MHVAESIAAPQPGMATGHASTLNMPAVTSSSDTMSILCRLIVLIDAWFSLIFLMSSQIGSVDYSIT
jgi:hypothetical protein